MSRRKSTVPPLPTPEKRKEKSRFPFRRGDSSRSFQEVDSPPPTSGQGLTPAASRDPEPPALPQPQFTRGETNGLMGADETPDVPRTNGNNFMDASIFRNTDQLLPQVKLVGSQPDETSLIAGQTPQELSAAPVSPSSPPTANEPRAPSMDAMTRAQEAAATTTTTTTTTSA